VETLVPRHETPARQAETPPWTAAGVGDEPRPDRPAPAFRLLGLLEVRGLGPVLLTARRQQVVLAVLLLNANRMVSLQRLAHAVWGSTPPATARTQIQNCVSALRRSFSIAGLGERIATRGAGYAMEVAPAELDLRVFEDLAARGRSALAAREPARARAAFREALALWRGDPLTGIDSGTVEANRVRILERRVEVLEDCVDAELQLGLHREVVGEIADLAAEHPLRERLAGQLMTALHRSGRRAEALDMYRKLRRRFIEELGLEPGPSVRRVHQDILTDSGDSGRTESVVREAGVAGTASSTLGTVPRMLPARTPCFTGQAELLDALRRRLVDDCGPGAAVVAVIAGRAGAGKSAAAIEAAHLLSGDFPDGQLYARMTDGVGRAQNTADVLEQFLRVLGFGAAEIPADLDSRAALYRSAIAGRRTLAVVDDAVDEAQVRPLVPGTASSRLIVTTRARAADLPGSIAFELDALGVEGGLELLTAVLGRARVAAEPREASELIELCGGLQLALAIVAVKLHARPHWTLAHVVRLLRDDSARLDQLSHREVGVRASMQREYRDLPQVARRLYGRLALLAPGGYGSWVSAPLLDLDPAAASDALETLVDARLVDVSGGAGAEARYRFHELARVHAREQLLADEPAAERAAALQRVFGAWLCLADEALLRRGGGWLGHPGKAARWRVAEAVRSEVLADPSAWFERERSALLAAVHQTAEANAVAYCRDLALSVAELAEGWHRFEDWRESGEQALQAARRTGDRTWEAVMQYVLGEAHRRDKRYAEAAACADLALGMFRGSDAAARYGRAPRLPTAA
jgi:DNA-binding SARP family transcriptional activator